MRKKEKKGYDSSTASLVVSRFLFLVDIYPLLLTAYPYSAEEIERAGSRVSIECFSCRDVPFLCSSSLLTHSPPCVAVSVHSRTSTHAKGC